MTVRSSPPLFCSLSEPFRPDTVPPTVNIVGMPPPVPVAVVAPPPPPMPVDVVVDMVEVDVVADCDAPPEPVALVEAASVRAPLEPAPVSVALLPHATTSASAHGRAQVIRIPIDPARYHFTGSN